MNKQRRHITVTMTRTRLVIWGGCCVLIAFLTFRIYFDKAELQQTGHDEVTDLTGIQKTTAGTLPPLDGKVVARLGLLGRTAHLTVLSGLQMNLYGLAAHPDGIIDTRVFARVRDLRTALRKGELDLACLPLRDAVQLYGEMGSNAPQIIAGVALGDEQYVVRRDVGDPATIPLAPLRIGITEPPILDLRRALSLDSDGASTVLLTKNSLASALVNTEIDMAIVPEPEATSTAARTLCRVQDPSSTGSRAILGGAVLVCTPAMLRENSNLIDRLLQMHIVSDTTTRGDQKGAVMRAIAALENAGFSPAPQVIWIQSLKHVTPGTAIPEARLLSLLTLLNTNTPPDEEGSGALPSLWRTDLIEKAQREVEENANEEDG